MALMPRDTEILPAHEGRPIDAPVILLGTHPRPKSKRFKSHKNRPGHQQFPIGPSPCADIHSPVSNILTY